MSKVRLPEAMTGVVIFHGTSSRKVTPFFAYWDRHAMEAYAAAKVREALEEAAQVCDTYFNEITEPRSNPYYDGALDAADILEQRIRALIPSRLHDSWQEVARSRQPFL